jgi:hypothetical protein
VVLLVSADTVPAQTAALPCGCDYSDVPGAVWWGPPRQMTVAELVAYAAPVFWFSPDEPSLGRTHGPGIMIPEPFPFQRTEGRPVVYYQLKEVVQRD